MKFLLISGLTVIVGYIVIQKTNFEISDVWKKEKTEQASQKEESPKDQALPLKEKGGLEENLFGKKFEASKSFGKSPQKGHLKIKQEGQKISVVPGTGKVSTVNQSPKKKTSPKSTISREESELSLSVVSQSDKEKKDKDKEKSEKAKVEKKPSLSIVPVVIGEKDDSEEDEKSDSQSSSKKSKTIIVNLPPVLTKVEEVSVSEIDLDDIEVDINDEKTKKDRDRNGDKITYKCTFTSSNREKGMMTNGSCDDIGDVNFSFDPESGTLRWILNEPGSTISGNYVFKIEGSDGVYKDESVFKVNISDGNSSEPKNNTSQVLKSAMAGSETFGNPLKEKKESK